MYKCSAKCCETLDTMEDAQRCVENCSASLHTAQGIIGQELQTFQARLSQCVVVYYMYRHSVKKLGKSTLCEIGLHEMDLYFAQGVYVVCSSAAHCISCCQK